MDISLMERTRTDQWEYLMLEIVPWLDGWQYIPLDDKGLPLEWEERAKLQVGGDAMNPPGLNDFGQQGWEVAGVVPEMHLYHEGEVFFSTKKTVLLLKRHKA